VQRLCAAISSRGHGLVGPSTFLSLNGNVAIGRFINRTDSPSLGRGHTISITAVLKPTSQLQVELDFSRARLTSIGTGELFFDGYIARTVCLYQFTSELLLRLIGQYDQFNKALDIFPLFSYKLNPYTIFYAGSTYSLTDYGSPFGTRQTARQYFIKLQYHGPQVRLPPLTFRSIFSTMK
jgi:hypothetical protein